MSLTLPPGTLDAPLIQTKTDLPLVPGQHVLVKVTGDLQKPSLQLVQLSQSPQDMISQTLRQQLPQQQAQPPLLANVNWAAKQVSVQTSTMNTAPPPQVAVPAPLPQSASTTALPSQISQIAKAVIDSLPTSQQLRDPNQLFKAMHLSGQYLEHSLQNIATGQPHFNPALDVRSQLLRLAHALRQHTNLPPTPERPASTPSQTSTTPGAAAQLIRESIHNSSQPPPGPASRTQTAQPQAASNASLAQMTDPKLMADELLQQIDGVLARMQGQQLQSLQAEQQGRQMWMMELPVKHEDGVDLFDLRLQRDGKENEQGEQEQSWSMTLAFDLEGIGPIRVQVGLIAEAITSNFWAELPETRRLFHEHIEHLRSRLNQSGLEVNDLSCQCGIPPEPTEYLESRLLDERV